MLITLHTSLSTTAARYGAKGVGHTGAPGSCTSAASAWEGYQRGAKLPSRSLRGASNLPPNYSTWWMRSTSLLRRHARWLRGPDHRPQPTPCYGRGSEQRTQLRSACETPRETKLQEGTSTWYKPATPRQPRVLNPKVGGRSFPPQEQRPARVGQ